MSIGLVDRNHTRKTTRVSFASVGIYSKWPWIGCTNNIRIQSNPLLIVEYTCYVRFTDLCITQYVNGSNSFKIRFEITLFIIIFQKHVLWINWSSFLFSCCLKTICIPFIFSQSLNCIYILNWN